MGSSGLAKEKDDSVMNDVLVPVASPSGAAVYCDFDGTIALEDVTDIILSRLADEEWLEIEADWDRGVISSKECMARQVALIRGGWDAVKSILAEIRLDPSFAPFAFWCAASGIPVMVVSDGLDRVIEYLLWRDEILVNGIWANHLNGTGDRLFLTFTEPPPGRSCESGLCKCQVMSMTSPWNTHRVVIGDGKSDYCWAQKADTVFAKSKLLEFCSSRDIPCRPFQNFVSIRHALEMMLAGGVFQDHYQPGIVHHAG
jgi:2-hydroxy-3-keto-5-methylthiopentenyl-1-phosphate phosphatase